MYQHILIAVDDSACSTTALHHGLSLAKEQGAEVRIVHVLDTRVFYTSEGFDIGPIVEAARRAGQEIVERAAADARAAGIATVSVAPIEALGDRIGAVIVAESQRWGADLIVIGTHGRHGIGHLFLGSVAEGVVRATSVPVLLIRTA